MRMDAAGTRCQDIHLKTREGMDIRVSSRMQARDAEGARIWWCAGARAGRRSCAHGQNTTTAAFEQAKVEPASHRMYSYVPPPRRSIASVSAPSFGVVRTSAPFR